MITDGRKKIKCFLFSLGISLFSTGFCEEGATSILSDDGVLQSIVKEHPDKENPDKPYNLLLPINIYDKTSLRIIVPQGFTMKTLNSGNPEALQFIGKNTVITISLQKGGQYQPTKLLDDMIKAMQAKKQVTILESGEHGYFGCMDGYRLVKLFDANKNITEVYYLYVASGPYDSATVLYNMVVSGNETVGSVVEKVKVGFNANIYVVNDK